MITNYLRTAFRFIVRNKSFSVINILGLSVGMACFIIIFLWIIDEIKYDHFHKKGDSLYRVVMDDYSGEQKMKGCRTPPALAPILKRDYPEIINYSRFFLTDLTLNRNNKNYYEYVGLVDSAFFSMFSFPVISGSKIIMSDWKDIVLSEKTAMKVFGRTDVVGEFIRVDDAIEAKIVGVIDNKKEFSHMKFDVLMNFELLFEFGMSKEMINNFNNPMYTYLELNKNTNQGNVSLKIADVIHKADDKLNVKLYLQKFSDIYLKSDFMGDYEGLGNIKYLGIFSVIAFLVLLIACINFMNISTAKSSARSKEVGMRKVTGATRKQLIAQFIGESVLLSFIAHAFAVIIIELILPVFNNIANKNLEINYLDPYFYLFILFTILFTGFLSGSYPAFYLSSFKLTSVLKKEQDTGKKGNKFRRILVVFQFAISSSLIISVLFIYLQINFFTGKDLGYSKENLIYFSLGGMVNKYDLLKQELIKNKDIVNVTSSSHILDNVTHYHRTSWEGKEPDSKVRINSLFVDADFVNTMEMKIKEGRDFNKNLASDSLESYLINEVAAKQLGFKNPIGKKFGIDDLEGKIIGVLDNFHFKSLHSIIEPMCLSAHPRERFYCYVKIKENKNKDAIAFLNKTWKNLNQERAFEYFYMDDTLENLYKSESGFGKLSVIFTVVAIVIAGLGLYGLASYVTERRTKEVSIRKAIGATTPSIIYLLTKEMLVWVVLANIVSWPLSYYFISKWICNFPYHIKI